MVLRGTCTSVRPRSFATHVETGRPQIEHSVYALRAREPNEGAGGPAGGLQPRRGAALRGLAAEGLHDPAFVALPVAVLVGGPLVVLLLALCQPDF